jgi:hypothetical protein
MNDSYLAILMMAVLGMIMLILQLKTEDHDQAVVDYMEGHAYSKNI